ncbi:MAG: hypothetical protein EOP53_09715 [Sphingobacteriales bacterium]|nr:MAG: hypothetical protein EOP53_09715 [Sphingobacteriales bacterium]
MKTINNNVLIGIIYLSILFTIVGAFSLINENQFLLILFDAGASLFFITGIFFLVKNGTFINSREFRLARLAISTLLVGVLFKILHFQGANEIMILGFLLAVVFYTIYFVKKRSKDFRSWLKLILIISLFAERSLLILHMKYADYLSLFNTILLLLILVPILIKFHNKVVDRIH